MDFASQAAGINIFIIIVGVGREIRAETTAAQPRERTADADGAVAKWQPCGHDTISLIVGAVCATQRQRRRCADALGHIFDRTPDRIAPVKRPLRSAQHFDPLDVVDIEHSGLRAVEIDIIEIQADAAFEARNWILLSDPADECCESRIGAARRFERNVWRAVRNVRDVDRARALELRAADGRNCDRDVKKRFLAAARRNNDAAIVVCASFSRHHRRCGHRRKRDAGV